jgi:hypothetical protein
MQRPGVMIQQFRVPSKKCLVRFGCLGDFSFCGWVFRSRLVPITSEASIHRGIMLFRPPLFSLPLNLRYTGRCPSVMSRCHILDGKNARVGREYVPD